MNDTFTAWQDVVHDFSTLVDGVRGYGKLAQIFSNIGQFTVPAIGWLRSVAIGLSAVFFIGLVVVLMLLRRLSEPVPEEPASDAPVAPSSGAYAARWAEITRHMDSAKEAEWKLAIIEADKLMDLVLQRAGFPGDTIGERLTNTQEGQIQTLEGLWEAHKVRNRIAHDLGYFLRYTEAKRAIELYAQTLREFEAI